MRILGYVAVGVSIPFKGYLCTNADLSGKAVAVVERITGNLRHDP
jgi:hypothetical protein